MIITKYTISLLLKVNVPITDNTIVNAIINNDILSLSLKFENVVYQYILPKLSKTPLVIEPSIKKESIFEFKKFIKKYITLDLYNGPELQFVDIVSISNDLLNYYTHYAEYIKMVCILDFPNLQDKEIILALYLIGEYTTIEFIFRRFELYSIYPLNLYSTIMFLIGKNDDYYFNNISSLMYCDVHLLMKLMHTEAHYHIFNELISGGYYHIRKILRFEHKKSIKKNISYYYKLFAKLNSGILFISQMRISSVERGYNCITNDLNIRSLDQLLELYEDPNYNYNMCKKYHSDGLIIETTKIVIQSIDFDLNPKFKEYHLEISEMSKIIFVSLILAKLNTIKCTLLVIFDPSQNLIIQWTNWLIKQSIEYPNITLKYSIKYSIK